MDIETMSVKLTNKGMRFSIPERQRQFELMFKVDRDGDRTKGFTVTAGKRGEAELFCTTFPEALNSNRGRVDLYPIRGGTGLLTIQNDLCPFQPATVGFRLNRDEYRGFLGTVKRNTNFKVEDLRPSLIGFRIRF